MKHLHSYTSRQKSSNRWLELDHHLLRVLRRHKLLDKQFIICVSGGADSMSLLAAFWYVRPVLLRPPLILHVHHGHHSNREFRGISQRLVKRTCKKWSLRLVVNRAPNGLHLKSELDLREFRRACIGKLLQEYPEAIVVTGHHRGDQIETQIMRLIRGTELSGLRGMLEFKNNTLRPWPSVGRNEIESYLDRRKINFVVDPTSTDFRSFLRQKWLPLLESRSPGASAGLARSLGLIAEQANLHLPSPQRQNRLECAPIPRSEFALLDRTRQQNLIKAYLDRLGMRNFTRSQIGEIIKQLDSWRRVHTFRAAGLNWQVDANHIRASG